MATRTGTQLFAKATIADDTIPAQVADQSEINGGWHSVADIAARDATALQYRRWGMVVNVENDANTANNKQWTLTRPSSGIADNDTEALMDNGNWFELASGASSTQADWQQTDSSQPSYINNKPTIPGDVAFDSIPTSGSNNAVTSTGIKHYVDTNIPAFWTVQGDVYSPYLFGYTLTYGYISYTGGFLIRYMVPVAATTGINAIKIGDIIYNTDTSGYVIGVYKVNQLPLYSSWDSMIGNHEDPDGPIGIPSHVFDSSSLDSNGLPVLDPAWNSIGITNRIAYVRVNGTSGLSFTKTTGFTIAYPPPSPCTVYGGYIYKDADGTWKPTYECSYVTGIGPTLSDSPYISAPSGLPYYVSDRTYLVDSTSHEMYIGEGAIGSAYNSTPIGLSQLGKFH
jgi:hypothetical protein